MLAGGFLARDWCDGGPVGALAQRSFALHAELAQKLDGARRYGYRRVDTFRYDPPPPQGAVAGSTGCSMAHIEAGHAGRSAGAGAGGVRRGSALRAPRPTPPPSPERSVTIRPKPGKKACASSAPASGPLSWVDRESLGHSQAIGTPDDCAQVGACCGACCSAQFSPRQQWKGAFWNF